MPDVCAVVVTHNRRQLLARCLDAIARQTQPAARVLVVDNASSDGTAGMLDVEHPELDRLTLERNLGGAAGFHAGLRRAYSFGTDWLWLMDDDTMPTPGALAELLAAAGRIEPTPLLLASKVVWRDGKPHPMNVPTLERRRMELVLKGAEQGMMPMRAATFVSLLVHRDAVTRFGLPREDFFIWSDDVEYTSRVILGGGGAYYVPRSVAVHETAAPVDFRSAPPERFYYHVRNMILTIRRPDRPPRDRLLRVWILVTTCVEYALRMRSRAATRWILRGFRDGIMGRGGPAQSSPAP